MMIKVTTIFLLTLALVLTVVNGYAKPVLTKQMTVGFTQKQPRFDAKTGNFVLNGVLHNTSEKMVNAPVALVIGDFIPTQSSIMLLKPDGFASDGRAYQLVLKKGTLAVGAKIPFSLRFDFSNPVNKLVASSLEALAKKALQFKPPPLANFQFQYRVLQIPAANHAPIANVRAIIIIGAAGAVMNLDGGESSDEDGDPLSYAWTLKSAPGSKAKLTKTMAAKTTFKPDLAGDYIASLTVSDGYVQSRAFVAKFPQVGGGVNHIPVIASYAPDSATATRSFTYQVTATDADKDKLTYTLKVSPPGMSINASGSINWSVPDKPHARIPVTVKVTDGKGGVATQSFSIHIQPCTCK